MSFRAEADLEKHTNPFLFTTDIGLTVIDSTHDILRLPVSGSNLPKARLESLLAVWDTMLVAFVAVNLKDKLAVQMEQVHNSYVTTIPNYPERMLFSLFLCGGLASFLRRRLISVIGLVVN